MSLSRSIAAAVLLLLSLCSGPLLAGQVSVAVAANFTDATRQIVPLFEQATGHRVKVSFGSTGKLYAQIRNGAPFEVFLAADTRRPEKTEQAGLAVPGSRFVYARGRLALWSPRAGLFSDGEAFLKTGGFKHLAMANPRTAPYGLAARQVMAHLGLWQALAPRMVRGDSIAQTFQFVVSGNTEAGFVAYSQVKGWQGQSGSMWLIPDAYYAPIEQSAVLLKRGGDNPAARAFVDFLKDEQARVVIERFGYGVQ